MSTALRTRLAYLMSFAGVPSYAREIKYIDGLLAPDVSQLIGELDGALSEAQNVVDDIKPSVIENTDITAEVLEIFWSETGSDDGHGLTQNQPVKTYVKAMSLCKSGYDNVIRYIGNVIINDEVRVKSAKVQLAPLDVNSNHSITIQANAANAETGGPVFIESGSMHLFNFCNIVLDSTYAGGLLRWSSSGQNQAEFRHCTFSKTDRNIGIIAESVPTGCRVDCDFANSPINEISGNVFSFVAAGENPNERHGVTSNIQSA